MGKARCRQPPKSFASKRSMNPNLKFCKEVYKRSYGILTASRFVEYLKHSEMALDLELVYCSPRSVLRQKTKEEICFERVLSSFRDLSIGNVLLEYYLHETRVEKYDLFGLWSRSNPSSCPVLSALLHGEIKRVTLLLRYGFSPIICNDMKEYEFFFNGQTGSPWDDVDLGRGNLGFKMILLSLFILHSSRLRITETECQNIRQCCTLLWRATSVLPCTPENFLTNCLDLDPTGEFNIDMGELYMEELPEMIEQSRTPYTLKHLSRCCVRKSLHQAWNLPNGIRELDVPKTLHQYLNLDE